MPAASVNEDTFLAAVLEHNKVTLSVSDPTFPDPSPPTSTHTHASPTYGKQNANKPNRSTGAPSPAPSATRTAPLPTPASPPSRSVGASQRATPAMAPSPPALAEAEFPNRVLVPLHLHRRFVPEFLMVIRQQVHARESRRRRLVMVSPGRRRGE